MTTGMSRKRLISAGILAAVAFFILFQCGFRYARGRQAWIKVTKDGFARAGKPYKFIGANAVSLVFYDDWDLDVEKAVMTAKQNGISVLRVYIDLGWGKDDDFDRIFDIARRHGVYIILVFTDCCCSGDYAGTDKYFQVHAPFCNITSKESVRAFKKLIKQIIGRRNQINGKLYRDDPVILAWEIANELEYWRFSPSEVNSWLDEIASYIKSQDRRHPVTAGISVNGFHGGQGPRLRETFNVAGIDFYSFHFYPSESSAERLGSEQTEEDASRIRSVTKEFLSLGKPVVMSEFGLTSSARKHILSSDEAAAESYNAFFRLYMDSAFESGASGVMFWGWGVPEEKRVPMWWSSEAHSTEDKEFCAFIKSYNIPGE